MQDKYNLTLEQNIFLAKRNLVDNIYANARMEGLNITRAPLYRSNTTIVLVNEKKNNYSQNDLQLNNPFQRYFDNLFSYLTPNIILKQFER